VQVEEELSQKLGDLGFIIDASAPRRWQLEMIGQALSPRKLKDGRTLSIRSFELKWDFLVSGRKVWSKPRQVPAGVIDVGTSEAAADAKARAKLRAQIRETVDYLHVPHYLFPATQELNLPEHHLSAK
jgi:hypothetical protein